MPRPARRTRLAPSPTGGLHLGNACTFLVTWALARNLGWELVLRIEDLDRERTAAAGDAGIGESLRWLGIDHDGEPVRQGDRLGAFLDAMRALADRGLVYPSPHSRTEVREAAAALAAPHAGERAAAFPAALRPRDPAAWGFVDAAVNHRLRLDPGPVSVHDEVAGAHTFDPGLEHGDAIVWTKSGWPAYQLAVCVDDAWQGITDVVRGDDLLPSAALQATVHRALGSGVPRWWHLPLVHDADGTRLAKRRGSMTLPALRDAGVDPGKVRGLCACWLGALGAPGPLGADEFRALVSPPILREWHARARSAPARLEGRTVEWLLGS